MNVLIIHNRYREAGGEDRVVVLEAALLARHGHTVVEYIDDNSRIDEMHRAALALNCVWSRRAYRQVRRVIAQQRIDLVHVHNTLPLVSPSVYYAAHAEGVPVVQTLHNYRLFCANGRCFRQGRACTECLGGLGPWPAVRHACYRNSRAATATVAAMVLAHDAAGTWQAEVDAYIAPTEFARRLFVSSGLPQERVIVKPHFIDPDPGTGSGRGGYALYVGRLSADKGVPALLNAWSRLHARVPLVIAGDGPLAPQVSEAAARMPGIRWVGQQQRAELQRLMGDAAFLIFPSPAYETFGQVIAEAYAAGTPVVAVDRSVTGELIEHEQTGLLARPDDLDDLIAQVESLLDRPARLAAMRVKARAAYESTFTADTNYPQLMNIYARASQRVWGKRREPGVAFEGAIVPQAEQ